VLLESGTNLLRHTYRSMGPQSALEAQGCQGRVDNEGNDIEDDDNSSSSNHNNSNNTYNTNSSNGTNTKDGVSLESNDEASTWLREVLEKDRTAATGTSSSSTPSTCRRPKVDARVTLREILREGLGAALSASSNEGEGAHKVGSPSHSAVAITGATVDTLLLDARGTRVVGCTYKKGGRTVSLRGSVVLCSGGYGADFAASGILARCRPDLLHLPTACNEPSRPQGMELAQAAGATLVHLDRVAVSPMGLVQPGNEGMKKKRLAPAEFRQRGIFLDTSGNCFGGKEESDEVIVSRMWDAKAATLLVVLLDHRTDSDLMSLGDRYVELGLMTRYPSLAAIADAYSMGPSAVEAFVQAFSSSSSSSNNNSNASTTTTAATAATGTASTTAAASVYYFVGEVTATIAGSRGGLRTEVSDSSVLLGGDNDGCTRLEGLFAAGEAVAEKSEESVHPVRRWLQRSVLAGFRAGAAAARHCLTSHACDEAREATILGGDNGREANSALASPDPLAAVDLNNGLTDLGVKVAADELDRWLAEKLTPQSLQACLAESLASGDLAAAAAALTETVLWPSACESTDAPTLKVQPLNPGRSMAMDPSEVASLDLTKVLTEAAAGEDGDAGRSGVEAGFACLHCRLPVKFEVTHAAKDGEEASSEGAGTKRYAYTTLFYGHKTEYLLGALVVGWSLLASGCKCERLLMYTSDVPANFLKLLGHYWNLKKVEYIEGSKKLYWDHKSSRFHSVFTKLEALNCTEYDKVLMLDIDMLIREGLDHLFDLPAPGALKRASGQGQPPHGGFYGNEELWRDRRDDTKSGINAGVMLLKPDNAVYRRMLEEVQDDDHPEHIGSYGPEQDYISRFYCAFFEGRWTHLHAKYNYQLMLPNDYVSQAHRDLDVLRDVAVAHYSGPRVKPWKMVQAARDSDLGEAEVERLLYDDSLRACMGGNSSSSAPPGPPRERVMDGVLIVEDQSKASGQLPDNIQAVMWEWVLALRECYHQLWREADLDLLEMIREAKN